MKARIVDPALAVLGLLINIDEAFAPASLKQQIHDLVEELPDNFPLLVEISETLRMNHAIGEAMEDVCEGGTFSAEEFTAKVQEGPRPASA